MYGTLQDELVRRSRRSGSRPLQERASDHDAAGRPRRRRGPRRAAQPLRQQLPRPGQPRRSSRPRTALDRWGYGMASVRFICGTQALHRELEGAWQRSSAPTTRSSSAPASTRTAVSSRRCSARGRRHLRPAQPPRSSTGSGSARRSGCATRTATWTSSRRGSRSAGARHRLIATDGVFSMDGYLAGSTASASSPSATTRSSWSTTRMRSASSVPAAAAPEHHGVVERVDILTGTLGKAIGGASGGYVSGRREIVELLRQRARPYLFSNTSRRRSPPPACGARADRGSDELRGRLRENTARFQRR